MELERDSIWQCKVIAQKPVEKLAASSKQTEEASIFSAALKFVRKKQFQEFALDNKSLHPRIM